MGPHLVLIRSIFFEAKDSVEVWIVRDQICVNPAILV